jgi:hypothetical protein
VNDGYIHSVFAPGEHLEIMHAVQSQSRGCTALPAQHSIGKMGKMEEVHERNAFGRTGEKRGKKRLELD